MKDDTVCEHDSFLSAGTISWQVLVERGVPHSVLWDLAKAILLLFVKQDIKGWSMDSTMTILEELIGIIRISNFLNHRLQIDTLYCYRLPDRVIWGQRCTCY